MRLLLAEDDRAISHAVRTLLERSGYAVDVVYDGKDALEYALSGEYDGLIFDWMLPGRDGVGVLRELRRQGRTTPCLVLTARDAVEDRVEGLDAGADDYLPKPFASSELMARIRAMLRRKADYTPDIISFGDAQLDRTAMELRCRDKVVRLSNKAYQLMEMLMEHPHVIHSVDRIMEHVWGWDAEAEINVVWVNISYLRKQLSALGSHVEIRVTRGAGYSLENKEQSE